MKLIVARRTLIGPVQVRPPVVVRREHGRGGVPSIGAVALGGFGVGSGTAVEAVRDYVVVGRVTNPQALVLCAGIVAEHHQSLVGVLVRPEPAQQGVRIARDTRLVIPPEVLASRIVQFERPPARSAHRFRTAISYGQNTLVTAYIVEPVPRSVEGPEREQTASEGMCAGQRRAAYRWQFKLLSCRSSQRT